MPFPSRSAAAFAFALIAVSCSSPAVDPALEHYIAAIKAVDNHAHPMLQLPAGARPDTEYDALPLDARSRR